MATTKLKYSPAAVYAVLKAAGVSRSEPVQGGRTTGVTLHRPTKYITAPDGVVLHLQGHTWSFGGNPRAVEDKAAEALKAAGYTLYRQGLPWGTRVWIVRPEEAST